MNDVHIGLSTSNNIDNNVTYNTNQQKAKLFARKFAEVGSNNQQSAEFRIYRTNFEKIHHDQLYRETSKTDNHYDDRYENSDNNYRETSDAPYDETINSSFEFHELTAALLKCKRDSAPGDDKISYEIIHHLPHISQTMLLKLYNNIANFRLTGSDLL